MGLTLRSNVLGKEQLIGVSTRNRRDNPEKDVIIQVRT